MEKSVFDFGHDELPVESKKGVLKFHIQCEMHNLYHLMEQYAALSPDPLWYKYTSSDDREIYITASLHGGLKDNPAQSHAESYMSKYLKDIT